MKIEFYGYPKCSTCKKAAKYIEDKQLSFDYINIKENPPKKELLLYWMKQGKFPMNRFFNTSGNSYREGNWKEKKETLSIEEACEALSKDGMLIKRPLLVIEGEVVAIGFKQEEWSKCFE